MGAAEQSEHVLSLCRCLTSLLPQVVAGLVGAAVQNVDVFSVQLKQERPPIIDVRYSAHGSPYFKAVMLDGILLSNRQKVRFYPPL